MVEWRVEALGVDPIRGSKWSFWASMFIDLEALGWASRTGVWWGKGLSRPCMCRSGST